jgi:hypothetical protein
MRSPPARVCLGRALFDDRIGRGASWTASGLYNCRSGPSGGECPRAWTNASSPMSPRSTSRGVPRIGPGRVFARIDHLNRPRLMEAGSLLLKRGDCYRGHLVESERPSQMRPWRRSWLGYQTVSVACWARPPRIGYPPRAHARGVRLRSEAMAYSAGLAPTLSRAAVGSPSDADMIDSAAFLVRSSAVGQRWAYVVSVVVAFA